MNQFSHKVRMLLCSAFFVTGIMLADNDNDNHVVPYLNFRSPGSNIVLRIQGMNPHKFLDMDGFYGTFNVNFQYGRSFRGSDIARALFGQAIVGQSSNNNDDNNFIRITGTEPAASITTITSPFGGTVVTRQPFDLMAENFLLPQNFNGGISIKPRVQLFDANFQLYFGFDEWCRGLYLEIDANVAHAKYNLHAEEVTPTFGGTPATAHDYLAGQLAQTPVPAEQLFKTALAYFQGNSLTISGTTTTGVTNPGVTFQPLQFAKIKDGSDKQTSFPDFRAELGYSFFLEDDYHLSLGLHMVFPTGKRAEAEWLFEAQSSNGKHFKLGVGVSGHYTLWRSDCEEHHLDFGVDATIVHWFKGKEKRTFDLKGKPLSRYMLAEQMKAITPTGSLTQGGTLTDAVYAGATAPNPAVQFSGTYAPVANFSTREINVSVGVEVDLAAYFSYICRCWEFDLGYNLWYRSKEKISLHNENNSNFPVNTWALKGDAIVYGYTDPADRTTGVALSATESQATIYSGTNLGNDTTNLRNTKVDSLAAASTSNPNAGTPLHFLLSTGPTVDTLNTSKTPVFIQETDLDLEGAETRGLTNKVWGFVNYSWLNCENWIPYLGAGFEGEFGRHSGNDNDDNKNNTTTNTESSSRRIGLSKWAVSVKLGVSFD